MKWLMNMNKKTSFLLKNLVRGFLWLAVLLSLFLIIKKNVDVETYNKYAYLFSNTRIVLVIYTLSEILFGIIPPELFMLWAMEEGSLSHYTWMVLVLTLLSYMAGTIGYFFGRYLNSTLFFRYIRKRFLRKYERYLNEYGFFLIIVAAVTPLPYSAVCMLVGSVKYPINRFFIYSAFRIVRFVVYGAIIWETVSLN